MIDSDIETCCHKVVISGIAGRFPNADNVTELEDKLLKKVDCTTEKHDRWDIGIDINITVKPIIPSNSNFSRLCS